MVAFLWPSQKQKAAYVRARGDALRAAPLLAQLLCSLRAAGCQATMAAHSLGCRVALAALLRATTAEAEADQHLCTHLVLLGAAVPADALAAGGDFPRGRLAAAAVTVFFSAHDSVLRSYFPLGEAASGRLGGLLGLGSPAMGLGGVLEPLPAGCASIDVSATVREHNPNLWLLSATVRDHIAAAAGGGRAPPSAVGGSGPEAAELVSAELLGGGLGDEDGYLSLDEEEVDEEDDPASVAMAGT